MHASEPSEVTLDAAALVWSKKLDDETRLEYHERAQQAFDLYRRARKDSLAESQPSKGFKSCFETCSSSMAGFVQAAKEHAAPFWTARRSPKSVLAAEDSQSTMFEAEWSTSNAGISSPHELGPLGCGVPGRTAAMLIGTGAGKENASPNKPVA
ncbi:hypothetical protein H632_c85p2 [Helicosporidium sp. ATCC 50920]|nr:hypothetical protein H632_c85p2 [Helicosporidium sp. ATCC 50920]|eukprot:KDD76857.1 hypothetical protein H632_c85p2 [Helicosporidium sp. ATCC 50920]